MTLVCIDCRYIGNSPSGIGEVTWGLVRHMPRLAPDLGFLLLRNAQRTEPLTKAPNVTEVSLRAPANGPQTMWMLPRLVDLRHVDLFHAPFNILPSGLRMRTLTTIHDVMWLTNPNWCNPNLYGQIERRFYANGINRALANSDAIATVSTATKDAIANLKPQVTPKISVTLSGVSEAFSKTAIEERTLTSIGLQPGQRFILTAGQFAPYKNHEGALRAFAKAFAARPDIALVMVQRRGPGNGSIQMLARQLGVERQVHFTGAVSFQTLLQLYSGASALLHPSFCEGFGNPVAEAMACGCPVITSNLSAMPEVANGAALLVDPYNTDNIAFALTKVVQDDVLRASMQHRGLKRAGELSWERFASENLAIYRKLLA